MQQELATDEAEAAEHGTGRGTVWTNAVALPTEGRAPAASAVVVCAIRLVAKSCAVSASRCCCQVLSCVLPSMRLLTAVATSSAACCRTGGAASCGREARSWEGGATALVGGGAQGSCVHRRRRQSFQGSAIPMRPLHASRSAWHTPALLLLLVRGSRWHWSGVRPAAAHQTTSCPPPSPQTASAALSADRWRGWRAGHGAPARRVPRHEGLTAGQAAGGNHH